MAKQIGVATHTFNPKLGSSKDLVVAFENTEPSVVMECSGAEPCIKSAVEILRVGGVGNSAKPVSFPMTEFDSKELTLFGSFKYGFNDFKTSVAILGENYKNGKENTAIDFESMITHRFKFDEAINAYDLVKEGNGCVKCIISGP
jgi:D-xylulose reductase